MPVHNSYVGEVFNELADLLEIQGANPFRVRAYRNAARVVSQWPQSIAQLVARSEQIPKLPGLGEDLSRKVVEIVKTGQLSLFREVEKKVPRELGTLLRIPGLGPKRVLALRNRFGIRNLRDLRRAVESGKVREMPGFGPKIEEKILSEIDRAQTVNRRVKLLIAEQIAQPLVSYLKAAPEIKELIIAGSYRRRQETVGDLDILATCRVSPKSKPEAISQAADQVMARFVNYDEVAEVIARGDTKSTVLLRSGIQVDLRVVPEKSYGAALHYFTGSKAHNIGIRTLGVRRGLKINEYGVFRGNRRVAGRTEDEVYRQVDLPYIEPELREMRGEVEAAREGRLPKLVSPEDIRGDLHAHTKATDGRLSLEEMAEAARALGYEYLAITEHSQHLTVAKGLTPRRLRQQLEEIDRLNEKFRAKWKGFCLLKAIEVDILEDGSLDLPDEVLAELDFRVCSVHSKFELPEKKQTERIIRAMDNPHFNILGHPTGRLIQQRQPYAVDLERVLKAAKERGCFLEINAQSDRMDLDDVHCKMARDTGVRVAISTDAHSDTDLRSMPFGISIARRGWLERDDVLNTRPWNQLKRLLKRG